jgi:hypothetical protein
MTPIPFGRIVRHALSAALVLASIPLFGAGCLDRPVAPASPNIKARVTEKATQNKISKIDLLFMIDNSSSMADKQSALALAVPDLVNRLVDPICINPDGTSAGAANAQGNCQPPAQRDFDPVKDIHIGIISSSLGGHGAAVCGLTDPRPEAHNMDMSHLLTRGATAVPPLGFLNWDGNTANKDALITNFTNMVQGVGQHGCGYEASLEAIYRFLIDPEPYLTINNDPNPPPLGIAVPDGIDNDLLKQRADFLRPDSLVAVIEVTDENDCSVIDGLQNFYVLSPPVTENGVKHSALAHGTSACLTNPNDKCCFNCNQAPPEGCDPPGGDPECAKGYYSQAEDPENLRCFNQKKRYGVDFLYPVQRYIDGFTQAQIYNRAGTLVDNPLFHDLRCNGTGCAPQRDPTLLFWAGIVGVPWQDIAVNPQSLAQGYKPSKDINWAWIIGDPANNIPPQDALMVESVEPRQGTNPALNADLAPPNSGVGANPINGHEWDTSMDTPKSRDLQYACIFDLPQPKNCADPANTNDCDCSGQAPALAAMMNPLCQNGGGFTNSQVRAKGYPGTRHLQVLQGLGEQGIVASICPAQLGDANAQDYGYRPAIAALIDRLRNALRGRCLPRLLEADPATGQVPCVVLEAFNTDACNCDSDPTYPGRAIADQQFLNDEIRQNYNCVCEILQIDQSRLQECQTEVNVNDPPNGWCYVDPDQGGSCDIVAKCPPTDKRIIRFIGLGEPRAGATSYITCQESSFPTNGSGGPSMTCQGAM